MQICIALAAVLLKLHMKLAGSLVWPDPTQTTRVGAHLSKLGPYTGNWAKSGGWVLFYEWVLFCETMVYQYLYVYVCAFSVYVDV